MSLIPNARSFFLVALVWLFRADAFLFCVRSISSAVRSNSFVEGRSPSHQYGINSAIATLDQQQTSPDSESGSIGVGFAIPSNVALRIANDIIKSGHATHGLLGATVQDVTTDGSATTSKTVGAKIASVSAGQAAFKAGA